MLFNSPLYAVFLAATWLVFWLLWRTRLPRALFLVAASYAFYFYGTWDAARDEQVPLASSWWALLCLAILFLGSTLDYAVGRALGRAKSTRVRNALLFVSLAYYVGVLGLFKYWNFGVDAFASALSAIGIAVRPTHLRLVLPFGISFFTFETMSYTIDVWRGTLQPSRRYLDYLLFVCFYPHLVAGPIVRPSQMLPQLAATPRMDATAQARGLWRIAMGLTKKIAIGDYLAQSLVNRVFATPERFTALEVVLAVYGYAVQIHADFSGYSDVAIGSAALFGYELPENFDAPYLSRDLREFWTRWHITLSTWLRDYLYKPLGGSRAGTVKTYRNLVVTMIIGGLWHGASYNFMVWGALHGGALAVTRMWQRRRPERPPGRARDVFGTMATFQFVCVAWVFFRAPTFAHATLMFARLARGAWALDHFAPKVASVVIGALLLHGWGWPRALELRSREAFARSPALVQGLVLAGVAMMLHLVAGAKPQPFVYGQF